MFIEKQKTPYKQALTNWYKELLAEQAAKKKKTATKKSTKTTKE